MIGVHSGDALAEGAMLLLTTSLFLALGAAAAGGVVGYLSERIGVRDPALGFVSRWIGVAAVVSILWAGSSAAWVSWVHDLWAAPDGGGSVSLQP
ncbi:MAG: hypothetical protein V3V08_12550 [Nannocystaceae bacterium]